MNKDLKIYLLLLVFPGRRVRRRRVGVENGFFVPLYILMVGVLQACITLLLTGF